jgi:hypothetical protein
VACVWVSREYMTYSTLYLPQLVVSVHDGGVWKRVSFVAKVLALDARVLVVEHVFRYGGEYKEEVRPAESHVPHRISTRQLIDKLGNCISG